jgi:hypothetical protein
MCADSYLLHPSFFHSVTMHAGDLLLMRQSVMHHGVANTLPHERVIFFDVLSTHTGVDQDEYTWTDHQWESAWGLASGNYIGALVRNAPKLNPLNRFSWPGAKRMREGIRAGVNQLFEMMGMGALASETDDEARLAQERANGRP